MDPRAPAVVFAPGSHGTELGPAWRNAPSTDSQNCCGSPSPRPTGTHAARPARPAWPIQDRSNTVLPLPGGPDTTVTRTGAASRPNSLGRKTTPPAPASATRPATASDPTADTTFPIIDRDWVRTLLATEIAFASDLT